MITQAWERHRRDQLAVSMTASEVNEVFMSSWANEMKGYASETFIATVELPNPFVTEIYTDTEPVANWLLFVLDLTRAVA